VFSNIEARFECLRCPRQTLAKAFQTHCALTHPADDGYS
jgi:hypothetical protein